MPELPDVVLYCEHVERRSRGEPLQALRLGSPFVLRTVSPRPSELEGKRVEGVRRLGKRIVLCLEDEHFISIHLMIAGRFQWHEPGGPEQVSLRAKNRLAAFDFPTGTLLLTEAGSKKRAAIHIVVGEEAIEAIDRGGLEVLDCDLDAFRERLLLENHTLKRTLTDPRLFSGIGNAYSDEILHRAQLSPLKWSTRLSDEEIETLYHSTREVLAEWVARFREHWGDTFPKKVTAFRPEMAVHGKYGEPCPVCSSKVQRIAYAENECNYCATCQTKGKLLADRALSRLLRGDWPRTLEDMEELKASLPGSR